MERIYKTLRNTGTYSVISGIGTIIIGLTVGVIAIIHGVKLLKAKDSIIF